jgi:hypothetical protein
VNGFDPIELQFIPLYDVESVPDPPVPHAIASRLFQQILNMPLDVDPPLVHPVRPSGSVVYANVFVPPPPAIHIVPFHTILLIYVVIMVVKLAVAGDAHIRPSYEYAILEAEYAEFVPTAKIIIPFDAIFHTIWINDAVLDIPDQLIPSYDVKILAYVDAFVVNPPNIHNEPVQ